jgi:predicted nucleic acid-binding protein
MKQTGNRKSPVLIDSSGWVEYLCDGPRANGYARYIESSTPKRAVTPTIVLYEVYKRLSSVYSEEEAIIAIAHIEQSSTVVDIDTRTALKGADLSIEEELPMADALICGVARLHAATIVTSDSHFRDKPGVIMVE